MAQTGTVFGVFVLASVVIVAMMPDQPVPLKDQATKASESSDGSDRTTPGSMQPAAPAPGWSPSPTQGDNAAPARQAISNSDGYMAIERAPDSHFYVDAEVNGSTVHFLVDTGASGVVLTAGDAQRVGITGDNYSVIASTAGGDVQLMPATADRVALGPFVASGVPLLVAKDRLSISLLGQSYLSRIGSVSINGNTMMLR